MGMLAAGFGDRATTLYPGLGFAFVRMWGVICSCLRLVQIRFQATRLLVHARGTLPSLIGSLLEIKGPML